MGKCIIIFLHFSFHFSKHSSFPIVSLLSPSNPAFLSSLPSTTQKGSYCKDQFILTSTQLVNLVRTFSSTRWHVDPWTLSANPQLGWWYSHYTCSAYTHPASLFHASTVTSHHQCNKATRQNPLFSQNPIKYLKYCLSHIIFSPKSTGTKVERIQGNSKKNLGQRMISIFYSHTNPLTLDQIFF